MLYKRLTVFLLILALNINTAFAFTDIKNHWSRPYFEYLNSLSIILGDNLNRANPESYVTRAEFITLAMRACQFDQSLLQGETGFIDVAKDSWFYKATLFAKNKDMLITSSNYFNGNEKINREEAIYILSKILSNSENINLPFLDIGKDYKYINELKTAFYNGIILGFPDNTIKPYNKIKRSEAAVITKRLYDYFKNPQTENISTFLEQYIKSYINSKNAGIYDFSYNILNSTGTEKQNLAKKADALKLIVQNGAFVNQEISDLSVNITEKTTLNATAILTYNTKYNITYNDNTKKQTSYIGKTKFYLENIEGKWLVNNSESSIYEKNPIIMAFEHTWGNRVDTTKITQIEKPFILSPTWFEIKNIGISNPLKIQSSIYNDNKNNFVFQDNFDKNYQEFANQKGYKLWALFKSEFVPQTSDMIFKNSQIRKGSINMLISKAIYCKLDGINFDFENMFVENRDNYTSYVSDISLIAREMGIVTSVDITKIDKTSNFYSMCYDRLGLSKAADYLILMGYDQNGAWSSKSGSVSQISWVDGAIFEILKTVPSEKLILGIPFYTRVWEETNGVITKVTTASMETAKSLCQANNAQIIWDEKSGQNFATYTKDGKTYKIWLEDEASVKGRVLLVEKYNLKGIAAWDRGKETPNIWDVIVGNL